MKFLDILFCDDIRHELNQKISLMGVYNTRIQIFSGNKILESQQSVPINLAMFLRFERSTNMDKLPDRFDFEFLLNSKSMIKVSDKFNVADLEKFNIAIKGLGVPLERGFLGFNITLYEKGETLLNEKQTHAIKVI